MKRYALALLVVICALAAGALLFWKHEPARPTLISHSNPDALLRVKDALRDAGIPFSTEMRDGREFVTWPPEHNAKAEAVIGGIGGRSVGGGRNAHFPDPALQKQFTAWLSERGIKHEIVRSYGEDYVVWDPAAGDLVRQFMESRGADCKDRAAGKGGAALC